MKFGVREICDVVLRAKANQWVGNKYFYKNEPVIYFDTLKTSSMEGAATTVYAQGGRGNSRLVAWEGERTVTFTMEDALISPEGFMILSGAGLTTANASTKINVHTTEQTNYFDKVNKCIYLSKRPSLNGAAEIFVMPLDGNGEMFTEPFKATVALQDSNPIQSDNTTIGSGATEIKVPDDYYKINLSSQDDLNLFNGVSTVLVDYYVEKVSGAYQIDITPDKFGGYYYLEASTLFRDSNSGQDMPAEFVIPKCKIQSNFTFTMASSGDPSTFTFTIDAFPDYTKFDTTKKVFAAIQIVSDAIGGTEQTRDKTWHTTAHVNSNDLPDRDSGFAGVLTKSRQWNEYNTSAYSVTEKDNNTYIVKGIATPSGTAPILTLVSNANYEGFTQDNTVASINYGKYTKTLSLPANTGYTNFVIKDSEGTIIDTVTIYYEKFAE